MLLSDKYKFGIYHVPKTGGSTLAHVLAPYLNETRKGWQVRHHTGKIHARMSEFRKFLKGRHDFYLTTVIRNPWDRMVSIWHYGCWYLRPNPQDQDLHDSFHPPTEADPSFGEFVRGWPYPQLGRYAFTKPQSHWLDEYKKRIARPIRFESLEADFLAFCTWVGLPSGLRLPHRLKRDMSGVWRRYYMEYPEAIDLVAKHFADDVALLGYDSPEAV
jgi:hypothetical protein